MRSSIQNRIFLLFALGLLLSTANACAQTGTTSLHGKVLDSTRAVVADATVTIANQSQGFSRSTTTPSTGEFEFLALPPGTYVLTVEKAGFKKYEQKNLQLLVNLAASVNVSLQVGALTTQVEVSGEAPAINTEDASMGIAFNDRRNGRQKPVSVRNHFG
jgi:hypothetical protein